MKIAVTTGIAGVTEDVFIMINAAEMVVVIDDAPLWMLSSCFK
jgi:hypothetical protein